MSHFSFLIRNGLVSRTSSEKIESKKRFSVRQHVRQCVLSIERLEERRLLTATPYYIPHNTTWMKEGAFLTGGNGGTPFEIAMEYIESQASNYDLTAETIRDARVTDQYTDTDTGITHIYLRQQVGGLDVENTSLGIHLTGLGQVITVSSNFVPDLDSDAYTGLLAVDSPVSAMDAALSAMEQLDIPLGVGPLSAFKSRVDASRATSLSVPGLSQDSVEASRVWVPNPSGGLDLAWEMIARTQDGEHWYHLGVDATTGEIRMAWDWIDHASYHVLPIPTESPANGPFQTVTDPHLAAPSASPFGWHDTNGIAGPEFTTTVGNNVVAHLDRNGDDVADAGSRPDGGSQLNFDATFNPAQSPLSNANVTVNNLFYWNNVLHDVHYLYGFTSAAGNFQTNTYGQGGLGSDAVQADGQDNADGGSANNANFGTPPDGFAPRMQMFEFSFTSPRRDSDMDSGIITHEYGHGVSNRLTGGPANASALSSLQSGGMGEGWSDFWSLMFRQRNALDTLDARGVGMYVLGQAETGPGIRSYRYDFDIGNQTNETFLSYGAGASQSTAVHWAGTRWASTLWDLNHLMIAKYGYESNLYNASSTAGNVRTLRLVMDALKLQPANPTFIEARNAILAADTALNGSENHREIWLAFARRGLGEGASTANSSSNALTTSFDIPTQFQSLVVSTTAPLLGSTVTDAPTVFTVNLSAAYDEFSVGPSDFVVNSTPATGYNLVDADTIDFTFATTPLATQGLHTMSMAAGSVQRASDSSPLLAFSGSFRWDSIPLQVAAVSPTSTSILPVGQPLVLNVDFNEPIASGSVSADDLLLSFGGVISAVALDADTARYTIGNLNSEATLSVTLGTNKVTDVFGNPNGASFSANYFVDRNVGPFAQPLVANAPLGGLIYETSDVGAMSFAGDVDGFTISLDPSQTLSVLVTPVSSTLRPQVDLLDPAGTSIGLAASPSNGVAVLLPPTRITASGTYRINVTGVGATLGDYAIRLVLNAALESENAAGNENQTPATAEDLTATSITLSTPISQSRRMGVLGTTDSAIAVAVTPSFTDISSTGTRSTSAIGDDAVDTLTSAQLFGFTFPFFGTTYDSLAFSTNGLITFGGSDNEYTNSDLNGSPALPGIAVLWDDLNIDNTGSGSAARAIFWRVTGTGANQRLIIQWNNVVQLFGSTYFTMQAILSSDGTIDLNYGGTVDGSVVTSATVGIKAAGAANPTRRLVHFNQAAGPLVGPNLSTRFNVQATPDVYKLNLAAGESLTLAIGNVASGNVDAQLIGTDGTTVIASGATGPTNLHKAFQNVVVAAAGTYFVRVSGSNLTPYSMALEVNASFDAESNSSFAAAQSIVNGAGVVGALDSASDSDWYSIDVTQPNSRLRIQSATPSDGAGEFLNSLDPFLELYSPSNTLLASGVALSDGRNESISFPLPSVGTYRIRVGASGGTKGEYYLSASAALVQASIVTRGLFYSGATGQSASTTLSDKVALLPGQSSTFANYSNYSRGLNGLVVDVSGLPPTTTNADFLASLQFATWDGISLNGFVASSVTPTVTILTSGGVGGSSRANITFPDNSIQNTWLRIVVLANAQTGLPANDVFYFGNVIGDLGVGNTASRIRVNATDTGAVRVNQSTLPNSASVENIYDINRDGRVNATDTGIVRTSQQTLGIVSPITAPSALGRPGSGGEGEAGFGFLQMPNDRKTALSKKRPDNFGRLDRYFASFESEFDLVSDGVKNSE